MWEPFYSEWLHFSFFILKYGLNIMFILIWNVIGSLVISKLKRYPGNSQWIWWVLKAVLNWPHFLTLIWWYSDLISIFVNTIVPSKYSSASFIGGIGSQSLMVLLFNFPYSRLISHMERAYPSSLLILMEMKREFY